ncbi:MAG: phage baseplate assembly protein V [Bacteroidia bacterium]
MSLPSNTSPTTTGLLQLKAGGELLPDLKIHSIEVTQVLNRIPTALVFILDGTLEQGLFGASNDPRLAMGKEIEIGIETGDGVVPAFKGIVVKRNLRSDFRSGTLLCLELKHAAVKMAQVRRSAVYAAQTDADLMQQLVGRHRIELVVDVPQWPQHEQLVQQQVSDWDMLVLRAEANGTVVAAGLEGIRVLVPETNGNSVGLEFGADILEFEVETDARHRHDVATMQGWDMTNLALDSIEESLENDGSSLEKEPQVTAISGDRKRDELHAWAQSLVQRSRLSALRGRLHVAGRIDVLPGGVVEISGGSTAMNGRHFVSGVHHSVSSQGWETHVEIGLDPSPYAAEFDVNDLPVGGLLARMPGLQIGTVERVDGDPQRQHRVLVRVRAVPDDQAGIWARVASLDAGEGHGAFFRPQVGDEVVLGFLNEDPRDAIILGGLFNGGKHKPAFDTAKPYSQQGIVTKAGLRLQLDETAEGILLETPSGDKLSLIGKQQGAQGILIQDQFGNKIELGQQGIVIQSAGSLTLEAATNVDIKANADLTAEAQINLALKGAATAELSSNGITDVKGSLVKIN